MPVDWIQRAVAAPYFVTERGRAWTPIGQNDAFTWPELNALRGRRDLAAVERHLRYLKASGVSCLRLMLEYCHFDDAYFETAIGVFEPKLVQLWDDLFSLCETVGLRLLLTPLDTFFTWNRWDRHPYNRANGGPCASREELLSCPRTRDAVKARLAFATERWGGSGVLFAWDLWNEMHPAQGRNSPNCFAEFIDDVAPFMRSLETRLHGRAHLQCVSVFGPELGWKPWLNQPIFRHPALDFACSHLYEQGTIDDPRDTVAAAISTGRLVREAIAEITDDRPFFDSEHGPIHTFKDHYWTLPEAFDDEYFRHMQWAHFASGGAGGGMRWPNRKPHMLTAGMRRAQKALCGFLPLIRWESFRRRNLNQEIATGDPNIAAFGCGDAKQAVIWLLRRAPLALDGRVDATVETPVIVRVPGLSPGSYAVTAWDTGAGRVVREMRVSVAADGEVLTLPGLAIRADLALAIRAH